MSRFTRAFALAMAATLSWAGFTSTADAQGRGNQVLRNRGQANQAAVNQAAMNRAAVNQAAVNRVGANQFRGRLQTPAQNIAAQLQGQAVNQALQRRGINARIPNRAVRGNNFYRVGRPFYRYGYGVPYGAYYPGGYRVYSPYYYGYRPYGVYYHRFPSGSLNPGGSSTGGNRLPGSNFFGDPHASQFFPK